MKKPCSQCPISKNCKPGDTGGSDVSVYVGQLHGPFWLPCHMDANYQGGGSAYDPDVAQCAGAAIYRANVGVADQLPETLLRLPPSNDAFQSPVELVAYHSMVPVQFAEVVVTSSFVRYMVRREMEKGKVEVIVKS